MTGKLLVAGASGLVGRAVVDHFERLGDWEIVGLSRRPPMLGGKRFSLPKHNSKVRDLAFTPPSLPC